MKLVLLVMMFVFCLVANSLVEDVKTARQLAGSRLALLERCVDLAELCAEELNECRGEGEWISQAN